MSLLKSLDQQIIDRNGGVFRLEDIADYCRKAMYKTATAERELRRITSRKDKNYNPDIERVYNDKGFAIIGYRVELKWK